MLFAASSGSPLSVLFFPLMLVAMYFLLIRPQQKRAKAQRELTRSIEEGDEVMTTSGIYGFVTAIEGDVVWLEIAEGIDVRIARAAVSKKVDTSTSTVTATDAAPIQPTDAPPSGPVK